MDNNNKETKQEQDLVVNVAEEEITKPDDSPEIQTQQAGQELQQEKREEEQQQHQQQSEIQEQQPTVVEEQDINKQFETTDVKLPQEPPQESLPLQEQHQQQQQQENQLIDYEQEEEDDEEDDDDDDDEEKETSQKLVIDIPDDEEEEEEDEKEEADDEVIPLDELPPEETSNKEAEKISPKPEEIAAIITLSDGEEEVPVSETTAKPGKVQKRRSMGAASVTGNNEEERYRLKRRKINVAGAPKMPLTGYVRYMNDRRESLRKEHPTKTAMEHTKMIGEEWHALPADVKSSYLKAADADKQRYVKELHSFLKSRPDVLASELAKNKKPKTAENNSPNPTTSTQAAANTANTTKSLAKEKATATAITNDNNTKIAKDNTKEKMSKETLAMPSTSQQANEKTINEKVKRKRTPTPTTTATTTSNSNTNNNNNNTTNVNTTATTSSNSTNANTLSIVTPTPGEIPIFTNEFLEHNKIYDMELRSLRKSKTDLEQQNSVLEKHVENMKFGVEKMITENNELEEKNRLLEIYLDKLKRKLALALSSLPLPSAPNGATVDNIDKYMQDLYKMSTSNSHGPATLNKAKDIIRKLDLQIQL